MKNGNPVLTSDGVTMSDLKAIMEDAMMAELRERLRMDNEAVRRMFTFTWEQEDKHWEARLSINYKASVYVDPDKLGPAEDRECEARAVARALCRIMGKTFSE